MLTALQTRKLTRAFSLFDVDQNGFMEQVDCELVVGATSQVMGYALGSPEYQAYYTEYMAGWADLLQLGDSDNDQRLTLAEFCTAYDKMMAQPERFQAVILGVVKTIITLWDSDKDGKVSQPEYNAYLVAFHATEAAKLRTLGRSAHLRGWGRAHPGARCAASMWLSGRCRHPSAPGSRVAS